MRARASKRGREGERSKRRVVCLWEQKEGDEDTVEVMTEAEAREREHYRLERKYMAQVTPTICLYSQSILYASPRS